MDRSEEKRQVAAIARLMMAGHRDRYIARTLGITRHRARVVMEYVRTGAEPSQWLEPTEPNRSSLEMLIEELERLGPVVPAKPQATYAKKNPRALEISLPDPHFGMRCNGWDIERASNAYEFTIARLLEYAKPYGPFDVVVFPLLGDILNADNVFHTTTAGTPQPEMDPLGESILHVERLLLRVITGLAEHAVVHVPVVPGNHDRLTSFLLGRILRAYFMRHAGVVVDASLDPRKYWSFGANLIGYEHGHSIPPIRLASIMATDRPQEWAQSTFREWHLGDQHRKATMKPVSFEESGVSIEYLPSLIPPNTWAHIKGFGQRRSGTAFVYDYEAGQIARLTYHLDGVAT